MKVIDINKRYRNGTKTHFLVLDDSYTNEGIDCAVEEWCDSDPAGANYGYSYEWKIVEDPDLIKNVINDKIKIINNQIDSLDCRKKIMIDYLSK